MCVKLIRGLCQAGFEGFFTFWGALPILFATADCVSATLLWCGAQTVPASGESWPLVCKSAEIGGPCRGRTYGPLIKSQLLYQLS
jgi:hypothetical protein